MTRTIRTADLIAYLRAHMGITGADDLFHLWLEEGLTVIREQPWPWNWKQLAALTLKPEVQTGATYTWTEGDQYVTSSAAVTLSWKTTGRRVQLGDEWYRTVDFGNKNANRIYVDRPILGSDAAGTTSLSFVRDDLAIPTSRLRTVEINRAKIPRYSEQFWKSHFRGTYLQRDIATPYGYMDEPWWKIDPPAYPPEVTAGPALLTFPAGDYVYFYTRVDGESGLESAPGPATTYAAAAGFSPRVKYNNPAALDRGENTSFGLRLYRSPANPTRDRAPMFLLAERSFAVPAAPYDDTNVNVRGLTPYWDGPWSTLRWLPGPDDTRNSVWVECLQDWGNRSYEEQYVELGTDNQVLELLRLFFMGVTQLTGRNTQEFRNAVAHFRSQMAYLVTTARAPGDSDAGPESHIPISSGSPDADGSWVDDLPWKT